MGISDIHRYRQRIRKEYRNHADAIEITSRNLFLTSEIIETVVATALKHMADVCAIKHSFVISLIYGIKLLGIDYDVLSYRNKPDSDNSDDDEPVLAIVVATSTTVAVYDAPISTLTQAPTPPVSQQ